MKKAFFLAIALSLAVLSSVYAGGMQAPTATTESATATLTGVIIDNMCAGTRKPEELAAFIKTHTKQCVLMPQCVASGYSIFADGKLSKFDKDSNAKIEEFLKNADSKLDVTVVAKEVNGELSLVSIGNQSARPDDSQVMIIS